MTPRRPPPRRWESGGVPADGFPSVTGRRRPTTPAGHAFSFTCSGFARAGPAVRLRGPLYVGTLPSFMGALPPFVRGFALLTRALPPFDGPLSWFTGHCRCSSL